MTTENEIKPAAPAEAIDGGRCAVDALFGLSDAAKQAVGWLYSEQARNLSVMEARAAILEGFGVAVDRELRSIFSKMDEEGPLRCLMCDGLEPCSHNLDAITLPNVEISHDPERKTKK